jgi:DNA topoisomerase IB
LGNTCAVCRQYYVHPAILDACMADKLLEQHQAVEAEGIVDSPHSLDITEVTVMRVLKNELD